MSSLSLLRKVSLLALPIILIGCQSLVTREDLRHSTTPQRPGQPGAPGPGKGPVYNVPQPRTEEPADNEAVVLPTPPPPVIPDMPKIGIILGGGGAKTYAHIGFLHELMKNKVPVQAIAGIEFAAPMAALYANKELANDVEWQMFKLKEEDLVKKSLLGSSSKTNEVTALKDFVSTAFAKTSVEDFKVPFTCPSYNLKKNQTYLMNRGGIEQLMYLCMAYPPFFKPYQGSVAAVRDVTALANYLRQKGANYIVFVNVLQAPGGKAYAPEAQVSDNVLWSEVAGLYNKPLPGVDSIVSLDTGSYGIMDFDKRREIMNRGSDSASKQLKVLARKWGF